MLRLLLQLLLYSTTSASYCQPAVTEGSPVLCTTLLRWLLLLLLSCLQEPDIHSKACAAAADAADANAGFADAATAVIAIVATAVMAIVAAATVFSADLPTYDSSKLRLLKQQANYTLHVLELPCLVEPQPSWCRTTTCCCCCCWCC